MSRVQESGVSTVEEVSPRQSLAGARSFRLGGLANKVLRNLNDYGWTITLQKSLAHLVRRVYYRQVYRIYRIKLDAVPAAAYADPGNFAFKILTPQNLEMIAQVEDTAEWLRGQVGNRIAEGQMCLVALKGDRVAGFNLINLNVASLVLVNRSVKLRRGSAWSEHIAVLKEFRRSGLGALLRFKIFEALKSRGIHRLYGGTLRSNAAALKLTRAVGFQEIGEVHYRKFLTFEEWQFKRVRY